MIELRWLVDQAGNKRLQQRTRLPVCDASGAFAGFGEWSEWEYVPLVFEREK